MSIFGPAIQPYWFMTTKTRSIDYRNFEQKLSGKNKMFDDINSLMRSPVNLFPRIREHKEILDSVNGELNGYKHIKYLCWQILDGRKDLVSRDIFTWFGVVYDDRDKKFDPNLAQQQINEEIAELLSSGKTAFDLIKKVPFVLIKDEWYLRETPFYKTIENE